MTLDVGRMEVPLRRPLILSTRCNLGVVPEGSEVALVDNEWRVVGEPVVRRR